MEKTIYYVMVEKEPGKRFYLGNSDFYSSQAEAIASRDYKRAVKTGHPVSLKERVEQFDEDGNMIS